MSLGRESTCAMIQLHKSCNPTKLWSYCIHPPRYRRGVGGQGGVSSLSTSYFPTLPEEYYHQNCIHSIARMPEFSICVQVQSMLRMRVLMKIELLPTFTQQFKGTLASWFA